METPDFYSAHALAVKQPRLKFGGPQGVGSNAGEGLQRAHQWRRRSALTYPDSRTASARYWYGSQAVADASSCMCWSKRRTFWTQIESV